MQFQLIRILLTTKRTDCWQPHPVKAGLHFNAPHSQPDVGTFGQALHVTYAFYAFHFNSVKLEMRAAPGGNVVKGCSTRVLAS